MRAEASDRWPDGEWERLNQLAQAQVRPSSDTVTEGCMTAPSLGRLHQTQVMTCSGIAYLGLGLTLHESGLADPFIIV